MRQKDDKTRDVFYNWMKIQAITLQLAGSGNIFESPKFLKSICINWPRPNENGRSVEKVEWLGMNIIKSSDPKCFEDLSDKMQTSMSFSRGEYPIKFVDSYCLILREEPAAQERVRFIRTG